MSYNDEFIKARIRRDHARDKRERPRIVRVEKAPDDVRAGRSKWDRYSGTAVPASETVVWRGEAGGMVVRVTEEPADSKGNRRKRRVHVDFLARDLTAGQASALSELLAEAATYAARKRRKAGGDT